MDCEAGRPTAALRLFALGADEVETTWQDYVHLFERFERATGECFAEDIKQEALAGRIQIWGLQDGQSVRAVAATQVSRRPRGHVCMIIAACGDASAPMQERLLDEIGRWAVRDQQCVELRFIGRPGWLRRFKRFRPIAVEGAWRLRMDG